MKKGMLLVVIAVLVMGLCLTAAYANSKTGTVTAVDVAGNKVTVKTETNDLVFTVTKETKITEGGKAVTLADVKVGAKVSVTYEKQGEDRVASEIMVTAAK